ncbi:MAG: hypothetical protein ACXVC5_08685 [Tumebacillaceae bacterium]
MEDLEMFELEPISGLEDLVQILETLFADQKLWLRLEMQEERGESVHDHILAQFASTLDLCDIVQSEAGEDVGIEFLFRELDEQVGEPRMLTMPIDPQDVEVDLSEQVVTLQSGMFTLTLQRMTKSVA